ncbi:unnamed protein product [Larinioides sclopetarius]|uniref:Uncharacterized protein n=1 Tax=Larinioides sclopetarius TaxID=280406 RepID=A0AAV2BVP0_9ARAC
MQSVEFCDIYYKYPTTIQTEIIVAKEFKLPAISLCFKITISFKELCLHEPELCKKPKNIEKFCKKHPVHCMEDTTNLTIPIAFQSNVILTRHLTPYLLNDSYNDAQLFLAHGYDSKTRTFIDTDSVLLKCYSDNLHLFQSGSKLETWEIDFFKSQRASFLSYALNQGNIELFNSQDEPQELFKSVDGPQVFVAIHSPYVPVDPLELQAIKPGKEYRIDIKLESEEHLLPPPYQTNCRDNGPSKDAKEFTNPNSYEMCLDLCKSKYIKGFNGCGLGMRMVMSEKDLCFLAISQDNIEYYTGSKKKRDRALACFKNCKQGCLKLQYSYKINEDDLNVMFKPSMSYISFKVKSPEVTIFRHVPLYGSGEIFSHVGGLLGCWLGMSVFTFADILEKFVHKVAIWKKRFRKNKKKSQNIEF